MLYETLADVLLALHLSFILFVVVGGVLALRWPWMAWIHLPAALWGVLVECIGWICPLTPLEIALRNAAGRGAYDTTFVEHYLMPIVYPQALTRDMQIALGLMVLVVNLGIYIVVWRYSKPRRA